MDKKVEICCCYAHEDQRSLQKLKAQLSPLLHNGSVLFWDDTDISPGVRWQDEINKHLETASIILLLVSADFMNSDYCYSDEMKRAMQRNAEQKVRVIPIILRPTIWQEAPFGKLRALPTGAQPVSSWKNKDQAFFDIAKGIANIARECFQTLYAPETVHETESALNQSAKEQLEELIQSFKQLRAQIASFIRLKRPDNFTLASCENQYNNLYRDTIVFLTAYLPEHLSNDAEGFVIMVHDKTIIQLQQRSDVFVSLTRWLITPLAKLERQAAEIDACVATLEFYKRRHFPMDATA